ncbi:helix-turn-helix domain-containing protein [Micrococcus sp.]|uniref:TetR/AcrR family transcriptional regulator n=1 Tax=Micrococcus sp. TaxID=1271 RepID=UPI002A917E49|nr:helix-turn-helix domain-containing protein [Micrococcus sp.]MDY6055035.1 helix-turn-helix domain-containing protein [Micrococcus sp.]
MRADARANRQDLVAAAARLMGEQGSAMSLRAVAQAAGVGVGTLYRHFPTRRDLVTAVMDHVEARLEAIVQRFLDSADTPAAEDAHGGDDVAAHWHAMARELGAENLLALLAARDDMSPEECPPPEQVDAVEERVLARAQAAVDRAARAGLVAAGVSGEQYLAGVLTVTRPFPLSIEGRNRADREWLLEVFLRGLRADSR